MSAAAKAEPLPSAPPSAPLELDAIRSLLDRRLPWLTHGELFSAQIFGAAAWPEQGWKLHVSATPLSAVAVLERTLPVLLAAGVRFKVVNTVGRLSGLNNGHFGVTQVGKFITAYPTDDTQAVDLAVTLDEGTRGLSGPRVPSDRPLRPGSLVHYRYGAFQARRPAEEGVVIYDLLDPAGRLTRDQRQQFYVGPPAGVADPFESAGVYEASPRRTGALGGRFLITDVLARSHRGGVYKAIDLGAQPPCVCLLKEFWHDVGPDRLGRDARAWGENEAALLACHAAVPGFPRFITRFDLDGNLYVALEYIEGISLDRRLGHGHDLATGLPLEDLLSIGCASAKALAALHALGIVYHDFKPGNLICTPEGGYRLVDFGLAWDPESSPRPALGGGTPFYSSPEQHAGQPPSVLDDIFAWGATMHYLACGERTRPEQQDDERLQPVRRDAVADLRPDLPTALTEVIDHSVAWEPNDRYASMEDLLAAFEAATGDGKIRQAKASSAPTRRSVAPVPSGGIDEPLLLARRIGDALCDAAVERPGGLCWATRSPSLPSDRYSPDLYDGSAGIALILAELARATGATRYGEAARGAARWLMGPLWARGRARPGFHCGEAGIGYLFLRLATLLDEPGYLAAAELRARRMAGVHFETLDLLYGAAGAAIFLSRLAVASGKRAYLSQAREVGDLLLRAAQLAPGGTGSYWEVPASDPSLPTLPSLGLAHGAAGIALALVELTEATGDERYLQAARAAADLLLARRVEGEDGGWRWTRDLREPEPELQAQCHGAVGIGGFFLRLGRLTSDDRCAEVVRRAAITAAAQLETETRSGVCHGLSGHGGFLLDCYQTFHDEAYLRLAQSCGQLLQSFRDSERPDCYRLDGSGMLSPDLMLGYGGVCSFYLRLAEPAIRPDALLA